MSVAHWLPILQVIFNTNTSVSDYASQLSIINREYPVEWVVRELQRNDFIVDDVRLFPINWGQKALQSQLEVCDYKLKSVIPKVMLSDTLTHSMIEELQFQLRSLSHMITINAQLKALGACFSMDYVVSAHRVGT
jgi:hypothetical protein